MTVRSLSLLPFFLSRPAARARPDNCLQGAGQGGSELGLGLGVEGGGRYLAVGRPQPNWQLHSAGRLSPNLLASGTVYPSSIPPPLAMHACGFYRVTIKRLNILFLPSHGEISSISGLHPV